MLHHMLRAAAQRAFSVVDPYFKYVTMLLHGDGSASGSDTVTPFNSDASSSARNVTINGDARSNNFNPYQAGYYSNYFDGSGDYLTAPNSTAFDLSTSDFTIEGFFYPTVGSAFQSIFAYASNAGASISDYAFQLLINSSNGINFRVVASGSSSFTTISTSNTFTLNSWNYVCVTRTGTSVSVYLNGTTTTGTIASTIRNNASSILTIGRDPDSTYAITGYLSNLRILKGTAVTPSTPTAPLTAVTNTSLLTCQSNRFIDNSTNAFTITKNGDTAVSPAQPFTLPSSVATYGSGYFDGSGDYLTTAAGYLSGIGTGNFTIEGWWNFGDFTVRTTYFQRLWSFGTGLANDVTLNVDTSGNLKYRVNDSIIAGQTSGAMTLNSWNHVAVVRSSGTVTIYLNGTSVASAADSSNLSTQASSPFYIGSESDGAGGYFYGYQSNLRITNTAVYTTSFTPSTTPLTAISGTSLLTTQYNGGGNNSGFKDSSQNNFPITRNGNTTQGTFSPYGSNWSNYFDGSGDYLTLPSNSCVVGANDFTLEAWVFIPDRSADYTIFNSQTNAATAAGSSYGLEINTSGVMYSYYYVGSTTYNITSTGTVPTNTWNHVVLARTGGTISLFINGVRDGTRSDLSTSTINAGATNYPPAIGINAIYTPFKGYISNFRLLVGSGGYNATSSTITVPTAPLTAVTNTAVLTCQSNRFKDNSTNNFTITRNGDVSVQRFSPFSPTSAYSTSVIGGSGYFDGSGDYLRVAYNSNLYPTTTGTDYTVECWLYPTAGTTGLQYILGTNNTLVADWGFTQDAGQWGFTLSGTGGNAGTVVANQWTHIAMTRSGSTVNGYVNGVRVLTTTALTQSNNGLPMNIGMRNGSDRPFTGYISDVRIVNGTAVYTGTSYTIPTAPLTAISNTQFLGNYTNAGILDNAMMNDLETVGNAQISTSVKKYGTGSMYFDGSGDYLVPSAPSSNVTLGLGSGDFTVEFWVYFIGGLGSDIVLFDGRPLSTNGAYPTIYVNSSSQVSYVVSSADRITSASAFSTSTWYHIAVARSGTSTKMFVNGTQVGSTYTDSTNYLSASRRPVIAINGFNETAAPLNGYIDDLRITKGVARYTTTFTPPTAAFPNN